MRTKAEYRTASKETYNRFCILHPDIKVSFKEWKSVVYAYNNFLREYILETGEKVKMPHGIGTVCITKKKIKKFKNYNDENGDPYINLAIDWQKTKIAGKRIYHLNTHSDGNSYRWIWFYKEARFALSDVWYFRPCRKSSRLINTYIKKPNAQYGQMYKTWTRK